MNHEDVQRALAVFDAVVSKFPDERSELLAQLCGDHEEIRARVERMLAEDDQNGTAQPTFEIGTGANLIAELSLGVERPPAQIAGNAVIKELGRGGVGVVYEAKQEDPARLIAVKVLRRNFDRGDALKRFRREAHVLARLNHPNIATVYDAGVGEVLFDEAPPETAAFIAMELVDGEPLDKFLRRTRPDTRAKLALFVLICDAVAHAHAEGVTHRDLKPDNILIDGEGIPKVLDFGVARMSNNEASLATLQTEAGQLIGTTAYMSPEQASGDPTLVGPRSDVYSLGVILHEMLAGDPPLDMRGLSVVEALRMVTDTEPPSLGSIAPRFRGDLETVVAKALSKEPQNRYLTAAEIGDDVRRHLESRPITARPRSKAYEFRRFVRRNNVIVSGIAAVFVALVAGATGTAISLRQALETQAQLEEANASLERVAEFQADVLEDLNASRFGQSLVDALRQEFLSGTDMGVAPSNDTADDLSAFDIVASRVNATNVSREVIRSNILQPAEDRLSPEFDSEPLIKAELLTAIGRIYNELGLFDDAIRVAHDSRALYHTHGDRNTINSVRATSLLGRAYQNSGRLVDAEAYFREALADLSLSARPYRLQRLHLLNRLGDLLRRTGRQDEALDTFATVIATADPDLRTHRRQVLAARNNTAVISMERGDFQVALDEFLEVRSLLIDEPGAPGDRLRVNLNNLMAVYFRLGDIEKAEPYARELVDDTDRRLGTDHPDTLLANNNLARILIDTDRPQAALEILVPLNERAAAHLPRHNEVRLTAAANLIDTLILLERYREARDVARALLVHRRDAQPVDEFQVSQTLEQLGICLIELGALEEANSVLTECVEIREGINPDHWLSFWARHLQGVAGLGADNHTAARAAIDEAGLGLRERWSDVTPTRRAWIDGWIYRWSIP
ncbi:MAG: serine/threonine-protein kinase [Planctomycetota bacterium]